MDVVGGAVFAGLGLAIVFLAGTMVVASLPLAVMLLILGVASTMGGMVVAFA